MPPARPRRAREPQPGLSQSRLGAPTVCGSRASRARTPDASQQSSSTCQTGPGRCQKPAREAPHSAFLSGSRPCSPPEELTLPALPLERVCHPLPAARRETEARAQGAEITASKRSSLPSEAMLRTQETLPALPPAPGRGWGCPRSREQGSGCGAWGPICTRRQHRQLQLGGSKFQLLLRAAGRDVGSGGQSQSPSGLRPSAGPTTGSTIPRRQPGQRSPPGLRSRFPLTWRAAHAAAPGCQR